jgi:hypothetical protein
MAEFHPPIARFFRRWHHHKRVIHNGDTAVLRTASRENRAQDDVSRPRRHVTQAVTRASHARRKAVTRPL